MALPLIGVLAGAGKGAVSAYQDKLDYSSGKRRLRELKKRTKAALERDTKDAESAIQVGQGIEGGTLAAERMADVQKPHLERLKEIRRARKKGRRRFGLSMLQKALGVGAAAASGMSGLSEAESGGGSADLEEAKKLMS